MKLKHLILAISVLLTSCNWAEWTIPDDNKVKIITIPDSLIFALNNGDKIIFENINNSIHSFDTFEITKTTSIEYSYDVIYGEYPEDDIVYAEKTEQIYIKYSSKTKEITLSHPVISFLTPQCNCENTNYEGEFIGDLFIDNKIYKEVYFAEIDRNCIPKIYFNTYKGILKFITFENDTFNIFKYEMAK